MMLDNGTITKDEFAKLVKMENDAKEYIDKIKQTTDNRFWVRLPDGKMIRKIDYNDAVKAIRDYFRGSDTHLSILF